MKKEYDKLLQTVYDRQARALEKYGFYVHYTFGEDNVVNYHTHGLEDTYEHMDFQIVLPIPTEIAHEIFWIFMKRIQKGEEFSPHMKIYGIIDNYPVLLLKAREDGRNILRIVFPDEGGLFPAQESCHPVYAQQDKLRITKSSSQTTDV